VKPLLLLLLFLLTLANMCCESYREASLLTVAHPRLTPCGTSWTSSPQADTCLDGECQHSPFLLYLFSQKQTNPSSTPPLCPLNPTLPLPLRLLNMMVPDRDHLHLIVTKAYEGSGVAKQTSLRMLTAFSVQASVGKVKAEKVHEGQGSTLSLIHSLSLTLSHTLSVSLTHTHTLSLTRIHARVPLQEMVKDSSEKALPVKVAKEQIDVLIIQAPRTKDLSPYVINLLCSAATSVLVGLMFIRAQRAGTGRG
jgi:hypothetical protein